MGQVGAGQVGAGQVGVGQVSAEQVGAPEVDAGQVGAEQVGAPEVDAGQVGASEVGAGQAVRIGLREKLNQSPLCRNGNWKIASRDRRPKPALKGPKCQKLPATD